MHVLELLAAQDAVEGVVGAVVGGVERFYGHDRGGKRTALGDEEFLGNDGILLGVGVEEVLGPVGLDITVALRRE